MLALKQQRTFCWLPVHILVPAIVGCMMLGASFLPWLYDPLETYYSAWNLPINIGWPLQMKIFSYGLLCLCCGIYAFVIAYLNWKALSSKETLSVQRPTLAGILCLTLFALFLWQYLCVDMDTMNRLAQHQMQAILMQKTFGYNVPVQLFPIDLYVWDISTFVERFQLLANNVGVGLFIPLLCGLMLLEFGRLFIKFTSPFSARKRCSSKLLVTGLLLVIVGVPACGLAALACEYQAKSLLSTGQYATALNWLDAARVLNPTLDKVSFYQVERGQAWYFLHPEHPNDESMLYLAYAYRQQGYYVDAYQQLIAVWNQGDRPSWLVDEISITLEQFTQSFRPLSSIAGRPANNFGIIQSAQRARNNNNPTAPGLPVQRMKNDTLALPWLEKLQQVDPSNVYAQYLLGRIQCDLHNYASCQEQMYVVLQSSSNADVQSSAYTYIAISAAQQGDYVSSRKFLLKAVALDYAYRNNTAREELSGLH